MAVFTMCYLSKAVYVSKLDTLNGLQYYLLTSILPIIALLDTILRLLNRRLVFTYDDAIFVLFFVITTNLTQYSTLDTIMDTKKLLDYFYKFFWTSKIRENLSSENEKTFTPL